MRKNYFKLPETPFYMEDVCCEMISACLPMC
jgi:hypothetical protein